MYTHNTGLLHSIEYVAIWEASFHTHLKIKISKNNTWNEKLKTISIGFFIFDTFFYIYIYYRKFNVDFNKLMQPVDHHARCFATHTPLPTILTLFGYFHILTYQVLKLKQNTKDARYVSCVH